jgi:hypothetical protein
MLSWIFLHKNKLSEILSLAHGEDIDSRNWFQMLKKAHEADMGWSAERKTQLCLLWVSLAHSPLKRWFRPNPKNLELN